jgi:hypothetical protein
MKTTASKGGLLAVGLPHDLGVGQVTGPTKNGRSHANTTKPVGALVPQLGPITILSY